MKTDDLRDAYLSFFESKGCTKRPSDVLVPTWDPSVLFTPAGMNQFKDHFLGRVKLDYTRATTCQKCLRTGDIENVGRTAYHHTFFEMLGNFSFGDYFKEDAIAWAWELLTSKKWLGVDPGRLTVSVYLDDDEAFDIWHKKIGLPTNRITRMGESDNFWPASAPSQGPDGVCGPCSEIFFHPPTGGEVEIWNLVFTQFNRVGEPPDNLRPLPSKNIDTGMGLERMASVMQGVETNFHIDTLRPIVEAAAEVCGLKYDPASENGRRLRRIADHVRACTFAIHENVVPGPNKQRYVVKRLLRRAVLDGHQMGLHEPFLYKLPGIVAESARRPYPELLETAERTAQVIRAEETEFFKTIDAGLDRMNRTFDDMRKNNRILVSGGDAADLYTTYGFPPELFASMAASHNLTFDWDGYNAKMEEHTDVSRGGQVRIVFTEEGPLQALTKAGQVSEFLGYTRLEDTGKVIGIVAQDELVEELDEVGREQPVTVVLDRSPFYGESGGQVGDTGELVAGDTRFEVTDTKRDRGLILHVGHLKSGKLSLDQQLTAKVNTARRQAIRRAHSATHLLHHALRTILGPHAQQQGSKVDADWLRFDFTHTSGVKRDELQQIEDAVNAMAYGCSAVTWQNLPLAEARQAGAMMLFGEKYPDVVRMVTMGDFSLELCGGTHLDNTGQVGLFRIVSEESVSAGTRRITALTGPRAIQHQREQEAILHEAAAELKTPLADLPKRVAALSKEIRELKKQAAAGGGRATVSLEELVAKAEKVGDVTVVVGNVPGADPNVFRGWVDQLRKKHAPVVAVFGTSPGEGKVLVLCGISRDLEQQGVSAIELIAEPAKVVGGGGGGRKDLAQAGGKHPEKLNEALETAKSEVRKRLGALAK